MIPLDYFASNQGSLIQTHRAYVIFLKESPGSGVMFRFPPSIMQNVLFLPCFSTANTHTHTQLGISTMSYNRLIDRTFKGLKIRSSTRSVWTVPSVLWAAISLQCCGLLATPIALMDVCIIDRRTANFSALTFRPGAVESWLPTTAACDVLAEDTQTRTHGSVQNHTHKHESTALEISFVRF